MDFKIIYEEDSDLVEFDAYNKGYRGDVIVIIGEKKYKLFITSMIRLQQDFELGQRYYGYHSAEPNMLFVTEVTKESIEKIVKKMYEERYFERLDNFGFSYNVK